MSALTDSTNKIAQEKETVGKDVADVVEADKTAAVADETAPAIDTTNTEEVQASENVSREAPAKTHSEEKDTIQTDRKATAEEAKATAEPSNETAAETENNEVENEKISVEVEVEGAKAPVEVESGKASTEVKNAKASMEVDDAKASTEVKDAKASMEVKDAKASMEVEDAKASMDVEDAKASMHVEDEKASMEVSIGISVENSETSEKDAAEGSPMEEDVAEDISPEERKKLLSEKLIAGRRFMKTNAFNQAADVLSVAASIGAQLFGDGHEDTFEVNFLYGKALLELGKIEDEVLTNALTDIPKAEGEEEAQDNFVESADNVPQDERAEIKQQVKEALGVVPEEPGKIEEGEEEANEEQKQEIEEDTEDAKEIVEQDSEKDTAASLTEDIEMDAAEEQGEEEESDAEASEDDEPIKLAWELLETSRCICEKKIKSLKSDVNVDAGLVKTWELNHADVLSSLGEHGLADSKYEQAQKDLIEALTIHTAHLPATSRILANTTHLLGKAFHSDSLFEKAAAYFTDAKNILIAKKEELKTQLDAASEEGKIEIQSEIKELEELIPDLVALVDDAHASAEQTAKIKEAAKLELENAAASISKMSGEETKDITSLVRRPTKRPASDEANEEIKKRKSEDGATTVPDEKAMETKEDLAPAPVSQ